jgi:hypothetical protein
MSDKKEVTNPILALAAGVILAACTAAITYYFTAKSERDKTLTDQKKEAYVGFVSAVDKDRVSRQKLSCDPEKDKLCQLQVEFEVQGGASLRRIAIYGDPGVVHAIAEYSRALGRLTAPCADTWKLDLGMFVEMRKSVLGEQGVSDYDLAELALPCKAPISAR